MGGILGLPFGRADPAIAIGGTAVFDMERADHAIAEEPMIILVARRELRIGPVTIKRPGQIFWQLPANDEVRRIGLEQDRREIALQVRMVGEWLAHDALLRSS
jgi:hypothetical protein